MQQAAAARQKLALAAVGIQAVIADLHKPVREDVLQKPTDKAEGRQGHRADLSVAAIVAPGETHPLVFGIDVGNAAILQGDPVTVSAQVKQQLMGAGPGSAAEHYPRLSAQLVIQ